MCKKKPHFKTTPWGWRYGSAVKSIGSSRIGPEFSSHMAAQSRLYWDLFWHVDVRANRAPYT